MITDRFVLAARPVLYVKPRQKITFGPLNARSANDLVGPKPGRCTFTPRIGSFRGIKR
jgi:hypothetical protein